MDDGSTIAETFQVMLHWQKKDHRFSLIRQSRKGVASARNLGILSSSEPWIALLDSDDLWQKNKLQVMLEKGTKEPDMLWHSAEIWIRNGVRVNPHKKHLKGGGDQFEPSTRLCVISPSASFFPRKKLTTWGLFDETFKVAEDYDLWLRITSQEEIGFIDNPLIIKRGGHADQLSKTPLLDFHRIRALDKILKFSSLSKEKKKISRVEIKRKASILLQGAMKRDNQNLIHFIQEISARHNLDSI